MKNQLPFYQLFYGFEFHRYFIRPLPFLKKPGQYEKFSVKTPKQLYNQVHLNSGFHPCYISIYDYGSKDHLKKRNPNTTIIDRVFFDFDIDQEEAHRIKNKLKNIMSHGLHHEKQKQDELREQLQNLIIHERIAEPAINQAKEFSNLFKKHFGVYPLLFFSGCKGCHAYSFFKPILNVNIKRSLLWYAKETKKDFNSLDLSVYGSLNSRVPYTKHQYSRLTVVPFQPDDSYDAIMDKSINPNVELFSLEGYYSGFGEYLEKIDPILEHNENIREKQRKAARFSTISPNKRVVDHRDWFRSVLGAPDSEYPDKEYVMYKCPFQDHDDQKPSFRVHRTGYKCYGCERKGNYFQFLKDYNGWTNEQVKTHLKANKPLEACI